MASKEDKEGQDRELPRAVKFLREVVGVLVWVFVPLKLFVADIDLLLMEEFAPKLVPLSSYRLFALLGGTSILWILLGHRNFKRLAGFVAIYPAVLICWRLPLLLLRRWPIALAVAPAVYDALTSFRATFLLYSFASISMLIIVKSTQFAYVAPAMAYLLFFMCVSLWRSTRKAYKASVFLGLSEMLRDLRERTDRLSFLGRRGEEDRRPVDDDGSVHANVTVIYLLNWGFEIVADRVQQAAARRIDLYLIGSWLHTACLISVVFAFQHWGLSRLSSTQAYSVTDPSFWAMLGYSVSTLTTSDVSRLEPISGPAVFLAYAEVLFTVFLVVILVFTILTAAREAYRSDIEVFIQELRLTAESVDHVLVDLWELSLSEAERLLLIENPDFVNGLRKTRGLPLLDASAVEESETSEDESEIA